MYIHSIKLSNYKSIGDFDESRIVLEPRITAIIGKNESGKSNVLEGLSCIQLINNDGSAFSADRLNRNCDTGVEIYFEIILKPTIDEFDLGIQEDSVIVMKKDYYTASGGISSLYIQMVLESLKKMFDFFDKIGDNPFRFTSQELTNYKNYRAELMKTEILNIPKINQAIQFFITRGSRLANPDQSEFDDIINDIKSAWENFVMKLPVVFYRSADKHLSTTYTISDIEKELVNATVNRNSLLRELVKLIGISTQDFITAARSGHSSVQISIRNRINKSIEEKINKEFQHFYNTEQICLSVDFNNGVVSFAVESSNAATLLLSERSSGLRWYLETFIDAKANNIKDRNVVYLLDEPGISLHVNAQRELINLFKQLAGFGNQIVYTTHSPYMLDIESDGIHRIRAVVKDADGYTKIYKTAYDSRIAPDYQKDTLAPIIHAMGMNLNDTFGPAKDKLNIVTEGMSDYIYIVMMLKVLGIDPKECVIIPSVGASNCISVCSILYGWGCKFIALFDYDRAGVEGGEHMKNNMFFEYGKHYCYMCDVTQEEINTQTYKNSPYRIEDVVTKSEIDTFCASFELSNTLSKSLLAKLMSDAVDDGKYNIGGQCKKNFTELFKRLFESYNITTEAKR